MSPRTNALLSAWASFDDPVTALLTIYVTAFLLGSRDGPPLVDGVELLTGVVLGAAAYGAQALTALVLTAPRSWRRGRARLILAQQNGMTAMLLALLVEPVFPGAIGIVVPAIVTANMLHALGNAGWDRIDRPEPDVETCGEVSPSRRPPTRAPLTEPDR